MPSKLGFGNTRKKTGKASYGSAMHYKNPIKAATETEEGTLLDAVTVSGGKGGKSLAQRKYDKMIEDRAAEEMSRGRYAGDNYKEAYANLPEENKIKYRAQAQKRIEKSQQ